MKSLRNQLIAIMILVVIVPFIASNVMGYYVISKNYQKEMEKNNEILAQSIADNVASFVDKAYAVTEEVAHNNDVKGFISEKQKKVLLDTNHRNFYFDLLYIQGTDGMQTAKTKGTLGNRSSRWWFEKFMKDKQPFVSKSYPTVLGNATIPVTSIFLPIYDEDDHLKGIMGSDLKLDYIQMMVEKFSAGNQRYAYVLDGEGVVIAHPDKKQVEELYNYKTLQKTVVVKDDSGKAVLDERGNQKKETKKIDIPEKLKAVTEKALKGEVGVVEYIDGNGEKVISAYTTIDLPGNSDNWAVITVQDKKAAMGFVKKVNEKNIFVGVGFIILVIFVAYIVASKITKPIAHMMKLMETAANGDLTVASDVKCKSEVGKLSESFNKMIKEIRDSLEKIIDLSLSVEKSSELLSMTTEQSALAIDEVARTIGEVANGANEQAKDAEQGVMATEELSKEIEKMSDQIKTSQEYANEVYAVHDQGLEAIKILENRTIESNKASKQVSEVVNELTNKTKEIDQIVETIMSIAEQTNLLALNAAIEAARAGDAGSGFAVVAEEVRKLAENTGDSSNNVKEIIIDIQKEVTLAQKTMKNADELVKEQNEAIHHVQQTSEKIARAVGDIVEKIQELSRSAENISNNKDQVLAVIENVSAVSEQTAAASQEVSASTEEQTASMQQLSSLAEELDKMAKELEQTTRIFKLN
ncbi:MAG: methyl-accepting chemotaxis protein [Marinisporobacter sp.]|jgi:methyl-accepting chemotaxis protein|nr:methyl-accepting chemotaxis protein [Marinisporobacter sp.]